MSTTSTEDDGIAPVGRELVALAPTAADRGGGSDEEEEGAEPPRVRKRPLSSGASPAPSELWKASVLRDEVGIQRAVVVKSPPISVDQGNHSWTLAADYRSKSVRSKVWGLVDVYTRAGTDDVYVLCRVCGLENVTTFLFLKDGVSSNASKHFESAGKGRGSETRRGDHLLAALYLSKNIKGGPRTREVANDGSLTQFLRPAARRDHHVRFVMMLVTSASPHAFARQERLRTFLAGLRVTYTPPAQATVRHHLTELASVVHGALTGMLAKVKEGSSGVPWGHISLDLWTARHSKESYGSLVIRFTETSTFAGGERSLGVWKCGGKHDFASIRAWTKNRLAYFGLTMEDIASSTTDSGANVRKAMIGFTDAWVPCAAHSLHNAVRKALGGPGESATQRSARMAKGGEAARRQLKPCPNDGAREALARLRTTVRFFEHSPGEAKRMRGVDAAGDPSSRGLVQDVATRWGSTYESHCRLFTMWEPLTAYFRSASLTAEQRQRRITRSDWDKLRHFIGVLTPCYEVTKAAESGTATLADLLPLLVALRKTMHCDTMVVPKYPEPPLAVGAAAIEQYLADNRDVDVMELDDRLFPSEDVYVDTTPGFECLCPEARTAVHLLRSELDRLFFSRKDATKNWLQNDAVLRAMTLTPGGSRMLREVATWLGDPDPSPVAEAAVLTTATRWKAPTSTGDNRRAPSAPPTPVTASRHSEQRAAARSSLVLWGAAVPGRQQGGRPMHAGDAGDVHAELTRYRTLSKNMSADETSTFWRRHREQLPTLYLVAASAFGAVGSSASCERDFSFAGRLVRPDRASLSISSVEMHSLVSANADLVSEDTASVPILSHAAADEYRCAMNTFEPTVDDVGDEGGYWESSADFEEGEDESSVEG
ncbi:hypothetical protein I4F81_008343 [Pyropia yezoensis]|uniref:Uncharacterized protein n=1 Tax=Pyropia yezoensis TaxID=2788 RepID=A0ACC3C761_PYRYE|nr:hypothetical protein I4F81_008343 [Neopyropia yezoensis]